MGRLYKLVITLLICVCSVPAMAQLGAASAGSVGAVAKTAAIDENLNDTASQAESIGQTSVNGKTNNDSNELKKKIAFTGAGLLTIIIIAAAAAKRRKNAAGKVRDEFRQ